ncbi:13E12 repeat-containing protein [Mycobacterium lentiflavum]|uniref:13E12 repeat-containing protein n=1 Tax=Mycobacterium lentiflavum TaxID=141349 RepID=A0A0E4H1R8_MYCLN|nr:HNH endonuclease signature motif containing protein [Mycobacterium lentiflavum]CQD15566.1 13E12 repeat-containing protein [Mycobacterium lentiflavum]
MFDGLQDTAELARADDATVVAAIGDWTRAEAAASSRRLAAIAELVRRHAMGPVDHAMWSCDNWDAMAAEVAAAQGISHGMASGQMYLAVALRDRLPQVAALFYDGAIGARLVAAIVWHTDLIKDPDTLRLVDTALAKNAARYGPLSVNKTAQAIDAIVDRYDPGALRRIRAAARSRDLVVDLANDESGTAAVWGRLYATDAAALDRRLLDMALAVCDDDPRTLAQRRADALGALAAGAQRLRCGCDNAECAARPECDGRATGVVIHVVAEASALESEPATSGVNRPSALIAGGGTVPAPRLAELAREGAKVRPLRHPGNDIAAESSYRPSAALDAFVRCRDLTCRFPNCDRPAEICDIDHTIPYPFGPTHPSNLKCLCRKHHLLKTFWTAWRDEQGPDGAVVWTSPSGHTYTTRPGSRLLFPTLCVSTGELPSAPRADDRLGCRGVMMPQRRRSREQERLHRINAERSLNAAHVAERNQAPPF